MNMDVSIQESLITLNQVSGDDTQAQSGRDTRKRLRMHCGEYYNEFVEKVYNQTVKRTFATKPPFFFRFFDPNYLICRVNTSGEK